jgi:hypothetical protein
LVLFPPFLTCWVFFFSWIKASKLCCCIRLIDFSATFCWSSKFWLLCLNLTCEFAFSIWHYSFLELCCKLFVRLYASLVYISRGIINVA